MELLWLDPHEPDPTLVARAAAVLREGGLVAFPTETVYGLGASALDPAAVARVFAAKGRPPEDPLIVHLASDADLEAVALDVPPDAHALGARFWPGPLTIVLPKRPEVPDIVTAGLGTVGVRVPAHPVALALLRAAGVPIAAPSANRFGHASPTIAAHVVRDLGEDVDVVLDGGPTHVGVESTVVDLSRTPPAILRPGGLTREALEEILGPVEVRRSTAAPGRAQAAPGMLDVHYAVRAELVLVTAEGPDAPRSADVVPTLVRLAAETRSEAVLLVADEDLPLVPAGIRAVSMGPLEDPSAMARDLYATLRTLEDEGVEVIVARDVGGSGLGLALRDRLRRAATRVERLPP